MRTAVRLLAGVLVLLPAVAHAGDMTPDQLMQRMMNCTVCKSFGEYPKLGPSMRVDVLDTQTGFLSVRSVADEAMAGDLHACQAKCDANVETAKKLKSEEWDAKLCPYCAGMFRLMARGDVNMEEFPTHMGQLTLVTSKTKEGVAALHAQAAETRKINAILMSWKPPAAGGE